eukprot:UN03997
MASHVKSCSLSRRLNSNPRKKFHITQNFHFQALKCGSQQKIEPFFLDFLLYQEKLFLILFYHPQVFVASNMCFVSLFFDCIQVFKIEKELLYVTSYHLTFGGSKH